MSPVSRKVRLIAVAAFACGAASVAVQAAPGPSWTTLAPVPFVSPLPPGVEGMAVAQIDGQIFAAMGLERNNGDTARMRIYDIAGDTWSFGADAPGTNSEGAGIAHGGLFYSVGGRLGGVRDDLWSYNPDTDTWDATLAPMAQGRAGLAVATVGNAIYAIGGRTGTGGPCTGSPLASGFLDTVNVYDPTTDTWSEALASMPTARAGPRGRGRRRKDLRLRRMQLERPLLRRDEGRDRVRDRRLERLRPRAHHE